LPIWKVVPTPTVSKPPTAKVDVGVIAVLAPLRVKFPVVPAMLVIVAVPVPLSVRW
jgi:hypothetical protein